MVCDFACWLVVLLEGWCFACWLVVLLDGWCFCLLVGGIATVDGWCFCLLVGGIARWLVILLVGYWYC